MGDEISTEKSKVYFGNLSSLALETEYRSIKETPAKSFYTRCLRNAGVYERAVGYFSSTVFLVVGRPVIEFVRKGGKIHLICSPSLSKEDVESIANGYATREKVIATSLIRQFDDLLARKSTKTAARTLSTLVASGALEIKIATRKDSRGIYHEKLGLFSDTLGNSVSFRGSTNETWSGWHDDGNFETIEVFCSWRGGLEEQRVTKHREHFRTMWAGTDPDLDVMSFPKTVLDYVSKYSFGELSELFEVQSGEPNDPAGRQPLDHQNAAIEGWRKQGCRGIFKHATGTGKTFTALVAIRDHVSLGKPALVLVPSQLLHKQWYEEIVLEIPEATVLLAGAGHTRWKQPLRLNSMTDPDIALGARIVLATMQTASTDQFRAAITDGTDLLLVADEVHQIGSPQNSKFMRILATKRLGLSATPERFGDPEGTKKIFDYFGPIVPPTISLSDAVKMGRLVPYQYYPHTTHLSATEAENWREYTKRIRNEIVRLQKDDNGRAILSDRAKMLLIQRSRIAKKATAKIALVSDVLTSQYEEGQSWLVYCEDSEQLSEVLAALRERGLNPIEYHSNMTGDRAATLDWFKTFGGVLVSIKCLDEGVDIPAVSHALILASSQNPRQFIQRRGRVLRKADDKYLAVIHDAIVVPVDIESEPEQLSLLSSELARSIEFASNAMNRGASAKLREIAIEMQIEISDLLAEEGIEDDG